MECLKNKLDSESKKRILIEVELKELRKNLLQIIREKREAPGIFDSNNSTSQCIITENRKRVTWNKEKTYRHWTAGCSKVFSKGRCVFKVKFLQFSTEICIGFFPTSVGQPENVWIGFSGFPGFGINNSAGIYGSNRKAGFQGPKINVGDIITAILD